MTEPEDHHLVTVEQASVDISPKPKLAPDGNPLPENDEIDIEPNESKDFEKLKMQEDKKYISLLSAIFELLNSLLGAGILSVPNTFVNTGIIPSLILISIIAVLSWIATVMLISLERRFSIESFPELTYRLVGKNGMNIYNVLALLFLISAQLAYLIVGSSCIISWFELGGITISGLWLRALVVFVYSMVLPIALTIPRNISFLTYFSTVTFLLVCFFMVALCYKGIAYLVESGGKMNPTCDVWKLDMSLFSSLSIYALTFALPVVASPILSLYRPETSKRSTAAGLAILSDLFLAAVPGVISYLQLGTSTAGDVLTSFPADDVLIVVVRGAFFFVVSSAYPLLGSSTAASWGTIIFNDGNPGKMVAWRRAVVLLISNGIPLLIAMFLAEAKPALAIGGAIGGCMANFTYPAILWVVGSSHKWFHWKNILAIIFAVFGLVAGGISTYLAVVDAIKSFS